MDYSYSHTDKDDHMHQVSHLETAVKSEPVDYPGIKQEMDYVVEEPPEWPPLPPLPIYQPSSSLPFVSAQTGALINSSYFEASDLPLRMFYEEPTTAQESFEPASSNQYPQLPAIIPAHKRPDWWMDALNGEDLMLVMVLTLDGRTAKAISRQLKISLPPTTNQSLHKPNTVYNMQRKVGGIFRDQDMPTSLMPYFAQGLVAGFRSWCTNNQGLRVLRRAREIDDAQGNRAILQDLARKRRKSGQGLPEQFGYTNEWAARQEDEGIWKALLLEWWTDGTVNGATIPQSKV